MNMLMIAQLLILAVILQLDSGAGAAQPPVPAPDIFISADNTELVKHSQNFTVNSSPFVENHTYLTAQSNPGAAPDSIRIAAPIGEYYVYIAWARHPQGAKDVTIRIRDVEVKVDQSRLASPCVPEDFPKDDMGAFNGVCTSGLFRLTHRPIKLEAGDVMEIIRSDTEPGTLTTLDYVAFSPCLYMDDVGNDAELINRPTLNLQEYDPAIAICGQIGMGSASIPKDALDTAVEFTVPADGPFLLSANPSLGPSRSETIPVEIKLVDGAKTQFSLVGRSGAYGRANWQHIGVLRKAKGVKIRVTSGTDGWTNADLLRLMPLDESVLNKAGEKQYDTFTLQWQEPTASRPWLRSVQVRSAGTDVETAAIDSNPGMPNGLRVRVARQSHEIPAIGSGNERGLIITGDSLFRVELADDYGFTLSSEQLLDKPFVWLEDLGIFACADGDFASHQSGIRATEARIQTTGGSPFVSTSEKYYKFTGYDEAKSGLDDQAFKFAYDPSRPLCPRLSTSIGSAPEVSYEHFLDRIQDPKHRRMFLGWPNVCQEFYVLSNGSVGVSSHSAAETLHPLPEHFAVSFGFGESPVFREHGNPSVTQWIEDGYHIICHTKWNEAGNDVHAAVFAYPMDGEAVRTGNEPLAAFVRLYRNSANGSSFWLRIRPDGYNGQHIPLKELATARVEQNCVVAGERIILSVSHGSAKVESASDQEVLVRLEPQGKNVELVIPYVAVNRSLVDRVSALGFDSARAQVKRYWDARLARGAIVDVPDPIVVNQYKTLYPRTLVSGDLDARGDYVLKTSPIIYESAWLHITAQGIEALSRRGHFEEARQYLDTVFRWQGIQPAQNAPQYTTWEGFFNAPSYYAHFLWLNFHGWTQWGAARYFLFSDDKVYLDEKLPALIKSLEWTASQRKLTMIEKPDGARPANYGMLPPGRVTDGSEGTSFFTDCMNWMGFNEVVRLLERVGHPRAAEFRATADDYRQCILRGLRVAARGRQPVRLNDGTYVPYVPGYLESTGHEVDMWYAAVVDAALEGILDSGIMSPDDPLEGWILRNLEDNLFCIAPNVADEAYALGHGLSYVRRDEPELAVYTLYSLLASHMSRQTLTTFEHRSWGTGRIWDLAPWAMGNYTRMLSNMICYDEGDEIIFCRAIPRAWLDPGKKIHVEQLQTRFGPVSFTLEAELNTIRGTIDLPTRYRPIAARLMLRVNGNISSVKLNGNPADYDQETGTVTLPTNASRITVLAKVSRTKG